MHLKMDPQLALRPPIEESSILKDEPHIPQDSLNTLIGLDQYLRNFKLFEEYQTYKDKNDIAIEKAHLKLQQLKGSDEKEQTIIDAFQEAIDQAQKSNQILEDTFSQYNFSKHHYQDTLLDYQIETYMFIKTAVIDQIKPQIDEKGIEGQKDLCIYVDYIAENLWDFFTKNFCILDDIKNAFDKAIDSAIRELMDLLQRKAV